MKLKTIFDVISKHINLNDKENHAVKNSLRDVKTLEKAYALMKENFLISRWLDGEIKKDVGLLKKVAKVAKIVEKDTKKESNT